MGTIITIGNFALFVVSAGLVAAGIIMDKPDLREVFLPVMMTALGVWIGMKMPEGSK